MSGSKLIKAAGPREKCSRCVYDSTGCHYGEPLAISRLYVKLRGSWKPVGWICPNCGEVRIDEGAIPIKEYRTVYKRHRGEH